ncbi:hypothetical protein F5X99DRAFT_428544 [Biscogniauxia marginata]|nr:hypothetical protein F5X99DRAFT_428544 [Biscogniauxia marginata]
MDEHQPAHPDLLFLHIPFTRRWEYHKNTITRLYIEEGEPLKNVAQTMKQFYKFDADVRQYKYHLKQWGIAKSLPSEVKDQVVKVLGKRAREGTDVGASSIDYLNQPSPFGDDWPTPSDISVFSPRFVAGGPSPTSAASPANVPTPTTLAIQTKTYNDRAKLLIQGKFDEFLKDMSASEKRIATTWLYHFWLFAFTTSKYWGRGPREWTPYLLGLVQFPEAINSPDPLAATRGQGYLEEQLCEQQELRQPSSLCHWSIHCHSPSYDYNGVVSPPAEEEDLNMHDPSSWPIWNSDTDATSFTQRLEGALKINSFSTIDVKDLPLPTTQITKAVASSPDVLGVEAVGFAIMARNETLLDELISDIPLGRLDLTKLFPFHLAASYLDGARACCTILALLVPSIAGRNLIKNLYINDLGHTVLDSLMMTILKGHTSCTPSMVDERLKIQRFVGEEVDLCGRWDADSPCFRALSAQGSPTIPFSWKHMFCHTSAQAICHSITSIFCRSFSPDINTPSGLFIRSCSNCNEKLVPGPLHTLLLTAFYLAQKGCEGENLFGALACLVCLLVNGADPAQQAEMSVSELLGSDDGHECKHSLLSPVELAEKVPKEIWAAWTDETKLGWDVLLAVLRLAQRERGTSPDNARDLRNEAGYPQEGFGAMEVDESEGEDESEEEDELCGHGESENFYGGSRDLGTLWAAIQTELLTYRRLEDGDPWLSDKFSMRVVRDGAEQGIGFSALPLVEREMMMPFCKCGRFRESRHPDIPMTEEACAFYFSNLEDWKRSNYLGSPIWDN